MLLSGYPPLPPRIGPIGRTRSDTRGADGSGEHSEVVTPRHVASRWYAPFMRLNARLALQCMGAFTVALVLQAAVGTRPHDGEGFVHALLVGHWVGILLGLVGGALPFLVLLSRQLQRELHRAATAEAQAIRTAAANLAQLEELHDANRLVTVGKLASMAHELGTPLGVVQARAQMIAGGDVTGAELAKDVAVILQQTRRMTQMVREVLELARHKTDFEATVDMVTLSRQAILMLDPSAHQQSVRFRLVDGVKAQAHGDPSKLLQILTNLANNAIEAMPGGGDVTFTVGSRHTTSPGAAALPADFVYVEVRDEGTGIARSDLPHIFDTFFTTKAEGSGLGLSVSYRIAAEHGGWIAVESSVGAGSCFTLFLPQVARV